MENLPKGVVPITWKDGRTTYQYQGKEYDNVEDIRGFLGFPVRSSDTPKQVGEVFNKISNIPGVPHLLRSVSAISAATTLPGEEQWAKQVGTSAQQWGIPYWIGETAGYLSYPGFGEAKALTKTMESASLARKGLQLQPVGLLSEASQVVDGVPVTNVFKVQLDDYVPGTGPLDAPVRSSTRTRLQRRGKSNELLREAGNTPEGIKRHKEALAYRLKHGSLKGYKDTTTPWILPDGEEIIFRKTDTGIKKSLKSDRASAQLQRSTNELIQTHGQQDWNELFEGFIDPKQFPIHKYEGHHARMVEGYTWAFDGADTKTTKKITEHFYNKKTALGKTQFNRNNLPHPVHKALHSWMDKQLGLNGLDMPSLKGLNAEQRIAHLEVYMEHIQPVIDEATFSLMKRYQKFGDTIDWTKPKAYKQLFLKDASMADHFIVVNL